MLVGVLTSIGNPKVSDVPLQVGTCPVRASPSVDFRPLLLKLGLAPKDHICMYMRCHAPRSAGLQDIIALVFAPPWAGPFNLVRDAGVGSNLYKVHQRGVH